MNTKKYLMLCCFLHFAILLTAQSTMPVSMDEVLKKAEAHNTSLQISNEDVNRAKADYAQTNAVLLPNITVSHTGFATTNPLMAFGSKLNQEILTQGDFNPVLLNDPDQIENFATRIEVQQPLINVDGIYQRKAARVKIEAAKLQSERAKDYIHLEVTNAYMQLQLAYKAVDVLQKALLAARENSTLANHRYEQGLLQKADVLITEVRVTEVANQLQNARSTVGNVSNYLSYLMNEKTDVLLIPTDSLNIIGKTNDNILMVSQDRADIKAMQLATDAYKNNHKADQMAFLPKLNAFGSYEMYDSNLFQTGANGYLFGAQLSWNILEGTKRFGKARKSKAEYEKSRLQLNEYISKSKLELQKATRSLEDAENNVALTQLGLQQSEESLRIRTNRFKEGLEKTSDLLSSETLYAQKQLEYYQAIYQHNYALAYLKFLTKE
ncbi:TolC family protein [Ascidiimonas aurantiaca]|uniref:TolC family protein n=1 Tax=Ascidiimonas aurantiaca TaxID=1685432 RepID=UPI0030EDCFA7